MVERQQIWLHRSLFCSNFYFETHFITYFAHFVALHHFQFFFRVDVTVVIVLILLRQYEIFSSVPLLSLSLHPTPAPSTLKELTVSYYGKQTERNWPKKGGNCKTAAWPLFYCHVYEWRSRIVFVPHILFCYNKLYIISFLWVEGAGASSRTWTRLRSSTFARTNKRTKKNRMVKKKIITIDITQHFPLWYCRFFCLALTLSIFFTLLFVFFSFYIDLVAILKKDARLYSSLQCSILTRISVRVRDRTHIDTFIERIDMVWVRLVLWHLSLSFFLLIMCIVYPATLEMSTRVHIMKMLTSQDGKNNNTTTMITMTTKTTTAAIESISGEGREKERKYAAPK